MMALHNVTPSWQRRRGRINHDELKNNFLLTLASASNALEGYIDDPEMSADALLRTVQEWERHGAEVYDLVVDFEDEMSPQIFFSIAPLANCDDETMAWLPGLIHNLWLARYPIRRWVHDAQAELQQAGKAYNQLCERLREYDPEAKVEVLQEVLPQWRAFHRTCQRLSKAIEQFPSEVLVT